MLLTAEVNGTALTVTRDAFETGSLGTLNRTTPKIVTYLENIRPHVAKIDAQLAPYFDGQSVVAIVDSLKANLTAAQSQQEVGIAGLPSDTLAVYERWGASSSTWRR